MIREREAMILIWSRWGILVALLAGLGEATAALFDFGFRATAGIHTPERYGVIVLGLGLLIGAGYIWLFDRFVLTRHLDKPRLYQQQFQLQEPQTLADGTVQTHIERTVELSPRSTFFFVPFKYWWKIAGALGAVVFLLGLVSFRG